MANRLVIGIVRKTHGVHGEVKVGSTSGEIGHFKRLRRVWLRGPHGEREIGIESVRGAEPVAIIKFAGYDSPETARELAGAELLVERAQAAPRAKDEHYIADIEGRSLIYEGEQIGTVAAVFEVGERSLLEIVLNEGRTVLIPFLSQFVGPVEAESQTIELLDRTLLE